MLCSNAREAIERQCARVYHGLVTPALGPQNLFNRALQRVLWALLAWWRVVMLGAKIMVLAFSPSSYCAGPQRTAVLRNVYLASAPLLTWFLVLSALLSLVLIRIVVATAMSYGLSQYALEVLVRTLVLELIPLYATIFVALRYVLPQAQTVQRQLRRERRAGVQRSETNILHTELLPRALAGVFSVLLLAAISCVVALFLTYVNVYGFSPWAWQGYTHSVGGVFTPAVALIFGLKTLFFSLAVAVVPMAGCLPPRHGQADLQHSEISEFARLFSVVLLIEALSLVGNYY